MRKIKTYLCAALALILALNSMAVFIRPARARAEDGLHMSGELEPLPSENMVSSGYLNRGNSGFRVNVSLDEGFTPYSMGIFLDSQTDPIDTRLYDTGQEYILSSNTAANSELQSLLSYAGGVEAHSIHLKYQETETGEFLEEMVFGIKADFELPEGSFLASGKNIVPPDTSAIKKYGLGDSVIFKFDPNDPNEKISQLNAKFNGRLLSFGPTSLVVEDAIREGDPDQQTNLVLTDVEIIDEAYNVKEYALINIPIDFSVDAGSPEVIIDSPGDGFFYKQNSVVLEYLVNDPSALVTMMLDNEPISIASGAIISNLTEGSHKLEIEAIDEAGNKTVKFVDFTVDTIAPTINLTNNLSERVEQGQELIIEGTSEPGADILLQIYSEPFTAHTVADAEGYFRIGVDTGSLSLGAHELYLTATDKAGNYFRKKIADFELIAKSSSASAAIAYAEEETVASDIKPPVIPKEVNQTEEVAKAGETSSTQDTRNGINWSVWIILLAVVVLVSAVGAAGYYGYEWIMASSATTVVRKSTAAGEIKKDQKETIRHRTQKSTVVKKSSPPSDIKEDEGEPRTRW